MTVDAAIQTTPETAPSDAGAAPGPRTLAVDIGGSHLKASVLDTDGRMIVAPARTDTPPQPTPDAVLTALAGLVGGLGAYQRVSIGFPGVIRRGRVLTAPNLGTKAWHGFPLAAEFARRIGGPVRLQNDATVQGLGVISGTGLECVITLGTGMGFAVFYEGALTPHMEMSQHYARKKLTYDAYVGNAAFEAKGVKRWNRRVKHVIEAMETLLNYDTLLFGGGNAKHIAFALPERVRIVPNEAGITGGVRLWDPKMDVAFANDHDS